jgi:hypothetical protein
VSGKTVLNQILKEAWYDTQMGPRPIKALAQDNKQSSRREHSFSPGLQTTVFHDDICTIKACVMEDIGISYTCENIYILSDKQTLKPLSVPR